MLFKRKNIYTTTYFAFDNPICTILFYQRVCEVQPNRFSAAAVALLLTAAATRLIFCFILSFHLYITLLYFLSYHALILLSVFSGGISVDGISESRWAMLLDLHDGEWRERLRLIRLHIFVLLTNKELRWAARSNLVIISLPSLLDSVGLRLLVKFEAKALVWAVEERLSVWLLDAEDGAYLLQDGLGCDFGSWTLLFLLLARWCHMEQGLVDLVQLTVCISCYTAITIGLVVFLEHLRVKLMSVRLLNFLYLHLALPELVLLCP